MAISAIPFVLQNAAGHPATLVRQALTSLIPPSGGIVESTDMAVQPTLTPSMAVQVTPGRLWIPGTSVTGIGGGDFTTQASYFTLNDGTVTLPVAAANATNPRVDLVCATVVDSYYQTGGADGAQLQIVTGTPADVPAVPATPANSKALAKVAVAAGATSITAGNITDLRSGPVVGKPVQIPSTSSLAALAPLKGQQALDTSTGITWTWSGSMWLPDDTGWQSMAGYTWGGGFTGAAFAFQGFKPIGCRQIGKHVIYCGGVAHTNNTTTEAAGWLVPTALRPSHGTKCSVDNATARYGSDGNVYISGVAVSTFTQIQIDWWID